MMDVPLRDVKRQSLPEFFSEIEKMHPVRIYYLEDWISLYQVNEHFNGYTLKAMLDELFSDSEISYTFQFGYALILTKDPASAIKRQSIISNAIIQRKTIERKIIGNDRNYLPEHALTLRGVVSNKDDRHVLPEVTIAANEDETKTTDISGKYEFKLMPGDYVLNFHLNGYDDKVVDLSIYDNGDIDISLQETPIMLEEVVISDQMLENVIGRSDLSVSRIKRLPAFLGEVDVIKQIQTQPGVTTVGEVATGFNVRGGSVDQNLVMFDDVPIFNTAHALGFFTAFNPDAISEIQFYRGGIPAQFGGRVSSVLNIVSRQGDYTKWKASGGIGLISSHLTLSGPIRKDTTSVLISMRSSYSDWMLKAIKSNFADIRNSSVEFYDGSLKLTHKLSGKGKLTLSGYTSHDQFTLADDTTYNWRNLAGSLRYDQSLSNRLFSSISFAFGKYEYRLREEDPGTAFDLKYSITYPSLKADFQWDGKHKISFGLQNTFYEFRPGKLQPSSKVSSVRRLEMPAERSLESALYISDGFELTDRVFIEAGLRYSLFNRIGPSTVYHYRADRPREVRYVQDSMHYENGGIAATYHVAEPRLSARYSIGGKTSIKVGYNRVAQYFHLITNSAAVTPTDIWQSSNAYFPPQIADQISAGIFSNLSNQVFETFIEGYYKQVRNVLDFKDGANLLLNKYLETDLVSATGTSYGVELSVTKVKGRLLGSVNYTFSRSFRQTRTRFITEHINNGMKYPANYDQPHVANVNWRYGISRRFFFSGNFVFHTGRPVSLPASTYAIDGVPVSGFSERNQYRIPDYHRLDLAFVMEGNHRRKKILDGNWVFSFYNVYARKNAYSVFVADDGTGSLKSYRLTVIGTIIPSVSYSFKF